MKFAAAQTKMISYLGTEDFSNREDAQDTRASIYVLQQIIKAGLITESSQEGINKSGFNKDSGNYYKIEERAYITGFMKKKQGSAFVSAINTYTDKVAYIVMSDNSSKFLDLYKEGKEPRIVLSIEGTSKKSVANIREFHGFTSISTVLLAVVMNNLKNGCNIDSDEETHYICVFDPKYGRKAQGNLYKDVLECLAK